MADSQNQDIQNSQIDGSSVQQVQAGGDAIALQNSPHAQIIRQQYFSLFGRRSEQPGIDWDRADRILRLEQQPEIKKRLRDTLYGGLLSEVDLSEEPELVGRLRSQFRALEATKTLTSETAKEETIDPRQPIIQIYAREDIQGKLLILGTPGAGKTTTLLTLAEQLVGEAIANPKTVIPIIFELSTWRDNNQSIHDWLLEQLYENFGGSRMHKIYESWLDHQVLLPLLDGLDELELMRQKKCTDKINEFARHYSHLVVCCRMKEFRQAGIVLSTLRGAVHLKALSDIQIYDYLTKFGERNSYELNQLLATIKRLVKTTTAPYNNKDEKDSLELFRVPLFLNLMVRAYDLNTKLPAKTELLEKYVQRQLSYEMRLADRGRKELKARQWAFKSLKLEPDIEQVQRFLQWIAQSQTKYCEFSFSVESLQPYWLQDKREQWFYWTTLFFLNAVATGTIALLLISQFEPLQFELISLGGISAGILLTGIPFSFIASTESKADGSRLLLSLLLYPLCFLLRKPVPRCIRKHTPILHEISFSSKIALRMPNLEEIDQILRLSTFFVFFFAKLLWTPFVLVLPLAHMTVSHCDPKYTNRAKAMRRLVRARINSRLRKYTDSAYCNTPDSFKR